MIRTNSIAVNEAWGGLPDDQVTKSFKNGYSASRVQGPARLLRLLYGGSMSAEGFVKDPSNVTGWYWFDEDDVIDLIAGLATELKKEPVDRETYLNRMAFATRDSLRQLLAICHDWTPRFDFIARLTLPPQKSVVGLVGVAKGQKPYSKETPGYEKAIAPDTILPGGLTQYVLRFDLHANAAAAANWIKHGINFNSLCR